MKPRLLDLFCGAGGAARGYQLAGFHVTGVDINPQPRYAGDEFIQGDALEYLAAEGQKFDAMHASPPCTGHTTMRTTGAACNTAWMLRATIGQLDSQRRPFLVENVPGAKAQMPGSVTICGTALGLAPLRRHRLFLASFELRTPQCACRRGDVVVGVYGDLTKKDRPANTGRRKPTIRASLETARGLMGCPWMDASELVLAIPPAYTEYLGRQLLARLRLEDAARQAQARADAFLAAAVSSQVPQRSGAAWEAYRLAAGHAVAAAQAATDAWAEVPLPSRCPPRGETPLPVSAVTATPRCR